LRDEGEFDAFAHEVDAVRADADLIAQVPFKLAGLCAAATGGHGKPCPHRERKDSELPGQNRDATGAKLAATHVEAQWPRQGLRQGVSGRGEPRPCKTEEKRADPKVGHYPADARGREILWRRLGRG